MSKPLVVVVVGKDVETVFLNSLNDLSSKIKIVVGQSENDFSQLNFDEVVCVGYAAAANTAVVESLLTRSKNCRWLHAFQVGVEPLHKAIDSLILPHNQALEKSGAIDTNPIPAAGDLSKVPYYVTNARGAFSYSLAEYVICGIMHFNKQVTRLQENSNAKSWDRFTMNDLRGKTITLVGYGDIAKHTARLCRAFGMSCIGVRTTATPCSEGLLSKVVATNDHDGLKAAFSESDFIVNILPGTAATRHWFNDEKFSWFKEGSVFVSIGRGTAVDENALYHHLESKKIVGAAMDVFEVEPLPASSLLWGRKDVLVSAHNADRTEAYLIDAVSNFVENYESFKNQKPFVSPVDLHKKY